MGAKIEEVEERFRGRGNEELKRTLDEGKIRKQLFVDGLIDERPCLRLIGAGDLGSDRCDSQNRLRREIVVLEGSPRAHIRWCAQNVCQIEYIRCLQSVSFEKVCGYIESSLQLMELPALEVATDVAIDGALIQIELRTQLLHAVFAEIGHKLHAFEEVCAAFHKHS